MNSKSNNKRKIAKLGLGSVTCSDELMAASATTMTTTTKNATAEPQQPMTQQQQQRSQNMRQSANSLIEGSAACPLTHQYHYIQYPAYYQLMHDRQMQAQQTQPPPTTCRCPCSCGTQNSATTMQMAASNDERQMHPHQQQHRHQHSDDSQMAVAVTVHRQAGGAGSSSGEGGSAGGAQGQQVTKTKSQQSLLNHSYQMLQQPDMISDLDHEEKQLNVAESTSCDCDLECSCALALPRKTKVVGGAGGGDAVAGMSALMIGVDEITVSESDNNSTIIKRKSRGDIVGGSKKKINTWCGHPDNVRLTSQLGRARKSSDPNYNSSQIDIYSDGDGDGTDSCQKINNGMSDDEQRPPLPPRPPPRPRNVMVNMNAHRNGNGIKKYVVWCLVCGGFSCLLGVLFLGVYFLLHSYTITVGNFETVPTFVPATLLILTGLCIMSLARRRNRYSYLIKLSGACGLISALTCALVTVTTTVLHMSRLQALRECEYAQKTRTCTCYSDMLESQVERVDKEGVRLVFDSLSDCGVVHGSLYSCLRAIFGLSVAGVLIAVFSCMLVYQLLSHERKKMYWEQLELRCRSLYTSQQGPPPPNMAAMAAAGGRANVCRCCEQCHAHRQVPLQPSAYPWDDGGEPRFWTGQPPGNFYSPNPGGDDLHNSSANASTCRGHGLSNSRGRVTGWSWPRMPWQRSSPVPNNRFRQTPSSPDSQYGFSNSGVQPALNDATLVDSDVHHAQAFNMAPGSLPYGVWGPPPPYSDPNSPARRGYYHYVHPNGGSTCVNAPGERQTCPTATEQQQQQHMTRSGECRSHHNGCLDTTTDANAFCVQTPSVRNANKRGSTTPAHMAFKSKGDYENTPSDSDGGARDRCSNTLPTRKVKKRVVVETGAKSIGPNSQMTQRVNVQQVFAHANGASEDNENVHEEDHDYHEPMNTGGVGSNTNDNNLNVSGGIIAARYNGAAQAQRHKIGVENSGFQNNAECSAKTGAGTQDHDTCDPAESEVYFADVSSCCNMSVKNDNYYEDANQTQVKHCHSNQHHPHHHHHQQHQLQEHGLNAAHSSHSGNGAPSDEDYLAQRFGKRENSVRSRLPFPQTCNDDYERNCNQNAAAAAASSSTDDNHMKKDSSRQSMCSVESEAKTEFTDLSPATPCGNKFAQLQFTNSVATANSGYCNTAVAPTSTEPTPTRLTPNTFVASFPYSSESQSLEAHRRSTRNINELMHTIDAQYEVINDVTPSKSISFPKANSRPTTLSTAKTIMSSKELLENGATYPSDIEWSDSSSCANDRQHM